MWMTIEIQDQALPLCTLSWFFYFNVLKKIYTKYSFSESDLLYLTRSLLCSRQRGRFNETACGTLKIDSQYGRVTSDRAEETLFTRLLINVFDSSRLNFIHFSCLKKEGETRKFIS